MRGLPRRLTLIGLAALGLAASAFAQQPTPRRSGLESLDRELYDLAERVRPAVVQVVTTALNAGAPGQPLVSREHGSGSGVVLDPEGYVVTNAHVVRGARRIQVVLASPPRPKSGEGSILRPQGDTVSAQLVGIDDETDLAVLRIEARGLTSLPIGDSEALRQGQMVLAFGSPLGLDNSVSMGVVSAVARQLKPENPMIYVQTDAPINPGNSGGPLVDVEGRMVGINTLILSQSGGNEGIGFAAPANIVREVFGQIRRTGQVRRGHIGVHPQTITPALAAGLKLSRQWGVVLADVTPGGPAEQAGLRIGDVVLALEGKPMENARQFEVDLYPREAGTKVALQVLRAGAPTTTVVTVTERKDDPSRFRARVDAERNVVPELGILGLDLDDEVAALLPGLRARAGVVVAAGGAEAVPGYEQLQAGDVVYSLNDEPAPSLAALRAALAPASHGDPLVLHVERAGELRYIVVEKQ
jgi:serine protease Do